VPCRLADHKDVHRGELIAVGSCLVIPLIGLIYVRVMGAIMRRAGVPPIEEQVSSLKMADADESDVAAEPVALKKAA
jgi:hypothetical protein